MSSMSSTSSRSAAVEPTSGKTSPLPAQTATSERAEKQPQSSGAQTLPESSESLKSPAFQFYPKDYLSDENQASMSLQETGAYIRLICRCWLEGSIPDDIVRVARLVGETSQQMKKCWPVVRRCFREHPTEPGRLIHARLERERQKQLQHRRLQSEKGRASAAKRLLSGVSHEPTAVEPLQQPLANSPISDLQSSSADVKAARATGSRDDRSPSERVLDAYRAHWSRVYRSESSLLFSHHDSLALLQQFDAVGEAKVLAALAGYFGKSEKYLTDAKHPFGVFIKNPMKYLAGDASVSQRPFGCRHQPACADNADHTAKASAERRQVPA